MPATAKPTFDISKIKPQSNKTSVKHSFRKTTVASLETVAELAESAKVFASTFTEVGHLCLGEVKSARLSQQLEQIDDLVTDFGLSVEEASKHKQAILEKHLG